MIIGDASIDPHRFLFDKPQEKPVFGAGEVAMFFFARTAPWFRKAENRVIADGLIEARPSRGRNYPNSARWQYYNFYEIERLAHAFAESGIITGERLRLALKLLKAEGVLWRYLLED
jgi:hypothetical protein